jgi:hypothetical protein
MHLGPPLRYQHLDRLSFPEAYGEELEVLGPLKVGRGYRFSFSYSVNAIEIRQT